MGRKRFASACRTALLLLLFTLLLCGCASSRGQETVYDGFTVRTERTRDAEMPERGDIPERSMPAMGETEEDYVLNKSTGKFHDPACPSVKEIKDSNRWDFHGTRESVLELGYQPCKNCSP